MKFGFVTCVKLGLSCMETIYQSGGKLDLVLTLRDDLARSKSGRIYVDNFCKQNCIDVIKVKNINDPEAVNTVKDYKLDWLFIIGWSQIARQPILATPNKGIIGIHPTLLPEGRGRAAIPWAILKGLSKTGVTMFKMDEGVDTGPIIAQEVIPLSDAETATELYDKVCSAHSHLIAKVWTDLVNDVIVPQVQDTQNASEWPGRKPEDGVIHPDMTVHEADRLIRATTRPYPGAFLKEKDGVIRVWSATIGQANKKPPMNSRRIHLIDGVLDAIDYQME